MHHTKTMTTSRIVAAMLAIIVSTAGLGTTAANASDAGVRFSGSFSGHAVFTSDTTVSFDGAGIATHLGFGVNHAEITIIGPDSSCPGGLANTHVETLTAANGDSLTITAHNVACPTSILQFRGSGHWVVTSGTGRFTEATGSGTIGGNSDFTTQRFSFVMSGTISAPGA